MAVFTFVFGKDIWSNYHSFKTMHYGQFKNYK